ncbi:MAG: NTP transferase domain-containing protein [Acidimicrobiales bacterium]|nr:NTP transferase domain-containing protein [Acidimicrobiales bacterium]
MSPTLVIMAGGLGTRFGGDKQLVPVGPGGETFLDLAITDAAESGIHEVVIVARTNLDALLSQHLGTQDHSSSNIRVVHQDTFGPARSKPWGTGHAVLCAAATSRGSLVVLNADDYYGTGGSALAAEGLSDADEERAVLVAYDLEGTLSPGGSVSRGVCELEGSRLVGLVETHGIRRIGTQIHAEDPSGRLHPDTPVSMNLWGLPRRVLDQLDRQWTEFYSVNSDDEDIEFLLPEAIEQQRAQGLVRVDVVRSEENWMGITNPDDLAVARRAFASGR